ncbi:hypothetical protein KP509_36G041900 [Ceratopteris richardii]|nr:hypothetical protein KP509_36G041900 [Ceratopteris richardii]
MAECSGAEFVEAVCDMSYASLAEEGFQHHQVFWELARRTHRLRCDYLDEPILSVQVTKFKDSGGFSVGVSMSHVVGDAQSFYDFVKCWGELCRGLTMTSPPVHMRTALSVKALFPSEVVFPSEAIPGAKITLEKPQQNGETHGKPQSKESLSVGEDLDELVKGMGKMEMDLLKKEVGRSVKKYTHPTSPRTQAPIIEKQLEQEDHRRPRTDLVQKVFTFSVDSLQRLKQRVNSEHMKKDYAAMSEISSKACNDQAQVSKNGFFTTFEAFCAHWWRCFVRAKRLPASQSVFLLIPINCRQRYLDLPTSYFGNALDGALVKLTAGDLCGADLADIAAEIHDAIKAATEEGFKQYIKEAEVKRNEIPHFDRTGLFHVVDSPKYPVYEVDFGFGIPEAVRAEGFRFGAEVQILASRLGPGSYDIFCAHDAETMRRLQEDIAFLAL